MKRMTMLTAACAVMGVSTVGLHAGEIDAGLEEVFANTKAGEVVSSLVFLWDQADIKALAADHKAERASFAHRNEEVVRTLRDTAALTQVNLLADLEARSARGDVESYESFWLANVVRVDATEQVLREIADRPDVLRVYYNLPIATIPTVDEPEQPRGLEADQQNPNVVPIGGVEPGVAAVRAPEVWAMGYTGQGVLVATMDTGVDGNHPALASRWRGLDAQYTGNPEWAWFDPITNTTFPTEFGFGSHGTHTMGSVLGGAPGDQIGVAPGAQWIHAGVIDRGGIDATIANAILSFEWMASPTGTPGDSFAVPRIASNSWGTVASHGHPACDETFWSWIDNSEAAGTAQFFSAGNEGGSGLRRPADRAITEYQSVAVAAVSPHDPSWPIASFSSRGPTSCTVDGSQAIKPDIAAPGVDTRSAVSGGGYGTKSGTSMASPHVNGVAALMLEACDVLTPDEIKQIIYDTAVDLGDPGKDNTYGWGMIDAVEAVNEAIAQCTIGLRLPNGVPNMLDAGVAESFTVEVVEGSENVVPGSELLFYSFDGSTFDSVDLIPLGNGMYDAQLPAANCDEVLNFYVQVTGDGGSVRTSPNNAPQNSYTALVGEFVTTTAFQQQFVGTFPAGWNATGLWNVSSSCPVTGDCQGATWAYYGQTNCNYDTGSANQGELLSAPIQVPTVAPGGTVKVSFCYNLETESSQAYDQARFSVLGEPTVLLSDASNWTTYTMDITAFAGETITLRWHFDTVDGILNDFNGWQIDNVQISFTQLECEDPVPTCPGDLNGDGAVNVSDMLALLGQWGACSGCAADLNGDGNVDVSDLLLLLSGWGACE